MAQGEEGIKAKGSVGVTQWLSYIQQIAVMEITGAMHTTVMDIMETHANVLPIELLMHRVCQQAAIRLVALLESHPLHKVMSACTNQCAQRHLSPMHLILRAYDTKPADFETK